MLEPKATSEVLVYPISNPKNTNHYEIKEQRMRWIFKSIFALVKIYISNNTTKVAKNTKFPAPKSPPKSLQKAEFSIETNKRLVNKNAFLLRNLLKNDFCFFKIVSAIIYNPA